jgi:hypothetical protein
VPLHHRQREVPGVADVHDQQEQQPASEQVQRRLAFGNDHDSREEERDVADRGQQP